MARLRALTGLLVAFAVALPTGVSAQGDAGVAPPSIQPAVEPSAETDCDRRALVEAAEADWRLREKEWCDPDDLARLIAAVEALDACAADARPRERWVFPVARSQPERSIGGTNGDGYRRARYLPCYATKYPGHPAHDLFVRDRHPTARDREGRPFEALAAEDGVVLVARGGWKEGDQTKGGNYVLLYIPARKWILYYAHLETVAVRPGDRVAAGQVVGLVGRTGKNALPHRSPTHLHFSAWDARTFKPFNPYKLLVAAETRP